MERFAFKIDKVLRANLYKICRLCGIDNPEKVPIIGDCEDNILDLDSEPELHQKINECIGLFIKKDDKMPQMICSLCVDKINDFYEFREMCYATNIQTRKLLGLKDEPIKPEVVKLEVKAEPPTVYVEKRGRKRKSDDTITAAEIKIEDERLKNVNISNLSKKRVRLGLVKPKTQLLGTDSIKTEVKNEVVETSNINGRMQHDMSLKQICNICNERFKSKYRVDRHKFLMHHPNIPRYFCTTCDVTIKKNGDIKNHQMWHKFTKTPYTCALCRDTLFSINMLTRHMREHAQRLSTRLKVIDRQCGQCHETFSTNFLYNTHGCALRTGKCGGCNRPMKNEIELHRHAAMCEKAYLMPSKYLTAALEAVKIKNENDVEAEAEIYAHSPAASLPGSLLEKITKTTDAEHVHKPQKRSNKKGISLRDLKRVDDLLKTTMDTLVSIKHEPEIHVEADPHHHHIVQQQHQNQNSLAEQNEIPSFDNDDDFHNQNDSSDSDHDNNEENSPFVPIIELQTGNEIFVKQEPIDDSSYPETLNSSVVHIKKELPDSGYEDCSASNGKGPLLKLKITKEHGTLNSSLVDENSVCREKKKKKKKRKEGDKPHEEGPEKDLNESQIQKETDSAAAMPLPGMIRIKQERLDDDYVDESPQLAADNNDKDEAMPYPEATIMTTIPMIQFQIANISSGVEFTGNDTEKDIKPNRAELDRLLELSRRTNDDESETNEETDSTNLLNPTGEAVLTTKFTKPLQYAPQNWKKNICRSKAIKSTGGGMPRSNVVNAVDAEIPRIIAVSSGFDAIAAHNMTPTKDSVRTNVIVKPEPADNGYETLNNENLMETPSQHDDSDGESQQSSNASNNEDEQSFINSIDFSNINIKQEKDIEVSEPQLIEQEIPNQSNNTQEDVPMKSVPIVRKDLFESTRKETEVVQDGEEEVEEEEEEEEDGMVIEGQEESVEREYRELEWPPAPPPISETENEKVVSNPQSLGLVISSVCSQVEELASENSLKNSNEPEAVETEHNDDQTIKLHVAEDAESSLKTSPCSKSISTEPYRRNSSGIENIDEEQQNIMNHEVLASREAETLTVQTQEERDDATVGHEEAKTEEETDNFFNENVVACDPREVETTNDCAETGTEGGAIVLEDRNVNEIAENNNNANIERELLDDNSTSQATTEQPQNSNEPME